MTGPEQWMTLARQNHQHGNLAAAESLYRRTLDAQPDHADARFLLGVVRARAGDLDEAATLLTDALDHASDPFACRHSLAGVLRDLGRYHEALDHYRNLTADAPQRPPLHVEYARTLRLAGDLPAAERVLTTLLNTRDDLPGAHYERALIRLAQGDHAEAEAALRRAIALRPQAPGPNATLGALLLDTHRPHDAIEPLRLAAATAPADIDTHTRLATALARLNQVEEADHVIARLVTRSDLDADTLTRLADLRRTMNLTAESHALYQRALALRPDHLDALYGIACLHERSNELDDALATLQRLTTLQPHPAPLLLQARVLRRLRRPDEALIVVRRVRAVAADSELSAAALAEEGLILDRLQRFDDAFSCFLAARRRAPNTQPTPAFFLDRLTHLRTWMESCDISSWSITPEDDAAPAPIFVMGFPRSGTTLVERILSAHPNLVGTDEAPLISETANAIGALTGTPYPEGIHALDAEAAARLRAHYWRAAAAHIRPQTLTGRRLVDKLPLNMPNLPAIRRLFPRARIIAVRRDPRDTLISCMMQRFEPGQAIAVFDTLDLLAQLYTEIEALWEVARRRLDLHVLDIHYEDLVDDPESHMRRLVDFSGEPWHDAVLRFHERSTGRTVSTPSYAAVAREIFTTSRGRWRHYAAHLAPVLPRLAPWIRAED